MCSDFRVRPEAQQMERPGPKERTEKRHCGSRDVRVCSPPMIAKASPTAAMLSNWSGTMSDSARRHFGCFKPERAGARMRSSISEKCSYISRHPVSPIRRRRRRRALHLIALVRSEPCLGTRDNRGRMAGQTGTDQSTTRIDLMI